MITTRATRPIVADPAVRLPYPYARGGLRGLRQQPGPEADGGAGTPSPPNASGWLVGWRLTFGGEDLGWEGALATLVEDAEHSVFVMLYDAQ